MIKILNCKKAQQTSIGKYILHFDFLILILVKQYEFQLRTQLT